MLLGFKLSSHEGVHFLSIVCKGLFEALGDVITDVAIQFMSVNCDVSPELLHLYHPSLHLLLHVRKLVDRGAVFLLGNFEYPVEKVTVGLGVFFEVVKEKSLEVLLGVDPAFDLSYHIFNH